MKKIISIIGWIVLLAAFASFGFATDNPKVGVPVYAVFFLIVFALVYLYLKKHHRKQEIKPKNILLFQKIIGIILLVIALITPYMIYRKIDLPFFSYLIITIITAILIILGAIAVSIINNSKKSNITTKSLGYLMLVVISAIPALGTMNFLIEYFNRTYDALGTTYWGAIMLAIFSWWGFSLFLKKE